MIDMTLVDLSRIQFAATVMYHFLFVPLTLGLSFLLAIMETVYVLTGRDIWRRMTIFWGGLFAINFALGVATGVVMEFQFGMNWAYYSQYVGDIFGAPLAIEGLMAFFLEATFVGLFFFGWDRLSRGGHLIVTWLVAIGSNFSALWILIANGWMQNPVGARFNPDTMRMELSDFGEVIFNAVAQAKFVHTVSAGYIMGSVFVMGISAWYMLRQRHVELAKRSMIVAASFGLLASLSATVLGDESGYLTSEHQKMKMAALEAMWDTEPAPAGFNLFAIPDQKNKTNYLEIQIPYVMGIIGTRSLDTPILGINQLVERAKGLVQEGLIAYNAVQALKQNPQDTQARADIDKYSQNMGYALLLKQFMDDISQATEADIAKAAESTVPVIFPIFWSFRLMVAIGFYFIAFFAVAFWLATKKRLDSSPRFWKVALWTIPLPYIAVEAGWFVAEFGRQPWVIEGALPTFYAVSGLTVSDLVISLSLYVILYTVLLIIGIKLMLRAIRQGPHADDNDSPALKLQAEPAWE